MRLPARQLDVLRELVRDGASNRTIGRRLYVTEDTVKTQLRRIYSATNVRDRTELVVKILWGDLTIEGLTGPTVGVCERCRSGAAPQRAPRSPS